MALFSVCSVFEGCRLVFLFYLFIYLFFHLLFLFYTALRVAFMGHWGGTLVAFTVLVGFYWALGLDVCALFSVCSVYEACRLVCLLYLFIYCVAWRGVACSVYGALGWGPCGVHSVWSVYEAFWAGRLFVAFRVFVTFMGYWGGTLVAFTVFLLSMECWGWTFVAFTAFVACIRRLGWSFWWRLEC